MNKSKWLFSVFTLVAIFLLFPLKANAQGSTFSSQAPGSWASSINIQNVGAAPANITINFVDSNSGATTTYNYPSQLAVNGSVSLYLPALGSIPSGQFSAVVSSDQPLNIVTNSSSLVPYTAGAYNGIDSSEIGSTLYFPGLYNSYFGFTSEVIVQNTTANTANVTLTFRNGAGSTFVLNDTIPANRSKVFPMASLVTTPALTSGSSSNGLFSLTLSSNHPVAGIAQVWNNSSQFSTYNAVTQGASTIYAPALYKNYFGFVSSFTVQNVHPTDTAVGTLTYSNGSTEAINLTPGQSVEFFQPNNAALPSGNANGVFSANVEVSSGAIVGIVNVNGPSENALASYNAATSADTSVNLPVVLHAYFGWFSAVTVQNVGTLQTNITITYAGGQTETYNNIQPNATVNIIQLAAAGTNLPAGSSVSAIVSSNNGQPLVAVVQENNNGPTKTTNPGDYLLAYTGVTP